MKHKHADLIHAWADGAEIQYRPVPEYGEWKDEPRHLIWDNLAEYRIKPEQNGSLINEGTKTKQGKPVGKFAKFNDGIWREVTVGSSGVLLYTHPKEWVGLTDAVRYQWLRNEFAHGRETYLAEGIPSGEYLDKYIDEQLIKKDKNT